MAPSCDRFVNMRHAGIRASGCASTRRARRGSRRPSCLRRKPKRHRQHLCCNELTGAPAARAVPNDRVGREWPELGYIPLGCEAGECVEALCRPEVDRNPVLVHVDLACLVLSAICARRALMLLINENEKCGTLSLYAQLLDKHTWLALTYNLHRLRTMRQTRETPAATWHAMVPPTFRNWLRGAARLSTGSGAGV
jgi:hypothetical protein